MANNTSAAAAAAAAACDTTVDILGIAVTSGNPTAIINELDHNIAERRPTRVAFLNTNLATVASTDPATKQALSSFIVLNDGAGVSLARKVLHGKGFAHNLNGTDFMPLFLDMTCESTFWAARLIP
jgi:UDP-N-acetyl-D-mannosaminuronic acid transferase (WecB/TagA/CpsF family)